MSNKIKIVCNVSGGVLQWVHISPEVDAEIILYDFDNVEDDPDDFSEYEAKYAADIEGLKVIL